MGARNQPGTSGGMAEKVCSDSSYMRSFPLAAMAALALAGAVPLAKRVRPRPPRLPVQICRERADGKPNFEGIWQASSTAAADLGDHAARYNMLAGRSVVEGAEIPYQPWAAQKRAENFQNRQKDDPLGKCYIPGVHSLYMYLNFPFQIFQTPQTVAMASRMVTGLSPHLYRWQFLAPGGRQYLPWMGDSEGPLPGGGHAGGSTCMANNNDKTWFDMAGNFHSDALHVVERYRMTDADTIFNTEAHHRGFGRFPPSRLGRIRLPLRRRTDRDRLFGVHVCQAEEVEKRPTGAFQREDRDVVSGQGPRAFHGYNSRSGPCFRRHGNYLALESFDVSPTASPIFRDILSPTRAARISGLEKHEVNGLTQGGRESGYSIRPT